LTVAAIELPPLYRKQHAAICDPARFVVIEASTKSGKTLGCLLWILGEAWNRPRSCCWWVAPTFEVTKTVGYERLRGMLRDADPEKRIWEDNASRLTLTLSNGSRIAFKSADNPDTLYGEDVHFAVVDEATRCPEESWHAVRSTLSATRGRCRIIGNLKGRKNWCYRLARQAESGTEPDLAYHRLTAADAVEGSVLAADEVEAARRQLPEHVFRELYLVEASDDGGNPFGLDAIRKAVRPLSTAEPAAFGIDLAKTTDWTVILGLDSTGTVCYLDRFRLDWQATRERIASTVGRVPTLIDSTGVGDPIVEDLQRGRSNIEGFKFTATSRQQLLEGLAAALQRGEVMYPEGFLRIELEAFEWESTRTGVRYTAPASMHDDGVMALALAVRRAANRPDTFRFRVI
jgi:phage FluMu gp28-like protein